VPQLLSFLQGESLYGFLERQVKQQMRDALGQPLSNISSTILNKMVSKEVAMDLKKYKNNVGTTVVKGPKRSRSKEEPESPHRLRGKATSGSTADEMTFFTNLKKLLRDLDTQSADHHNLF
jgi:hypothetical protein